MKLQQYLRHKDMRDVCFQPLSGANIYKGMIKLTGQWVNIACPKPVGWFPIITETIKIKLIDWKDWRRYDSLSQAKQGVITSEQETGSRR